MVKNVVIIGSSSGGILARDLENRLPKTHRIIMIERLEFAYHPVSSLRGAVQPGEA